MEEQSFLIQFFEAFYAELIRQKRRALLALQRPDISQNQEENEDEALVESIAHELMQVLEKQHFSVLHHGGEYALSLYREVQYVMVALADEFFLNMNWRGIKFWEVNILEQRVFNTHIAGESIFDRLEGLLKQRDPERNDVAKVYLLALGLGLRGKYRDEEAQITSYKRRLYLFINHTHPRLREEDYVLFPQTYSCLLEDGLVKQLPNPRVWHTILFLSIFLVMIVSYAFWYTATKEVHVVAKQIVNVSGVDKP